MALLLMRSLIFVLFTMYVFGDEIEMELRNGRVLKMLRDMVNQTAADTLNLPANASSIRENITDTFSCENRTYGYYADVDNDCQLFHVCLPSQTPAGRNVTYKWSFICPEETVFNQEVLVCTRPRDSIPCEESPNFYDLNMEIGKEVTEEDNPKKEEKEDDNPKKETEEDNPKKEETGSTKAPVKETETVTVKNQKRQPVRRKQNIIVEELMKEAFEEMQAVEDLEVESPELGEENVEIETNAAQKVDDEFYNARLGMERKLGRQGRNWRGSKKYSNA